MIQKFQSILATNFPFLANKKLIVATSGGLDSMVLLHIFQNLNQEIAVAHCNFQLRGLESFEDQNFVQDFAVANDIPIFITQFDTENFAKDYKLSIQVAARNLRYDWFYDILESKKYDYILTAHHADDNLETFIINLSRGTGLEGLVGIPSQNENIIRPLLAFSRQEIENYAKENNIKWREDSSNASDKYLRNKIRHNIISQLKKMIPNFLDSFQKSQNYLQESQSMVEDAVNMMYQNVALEIEDEIHFDVKKLKTLPNYKSYLYQFLKVYSFTAWNDIYNLVNSQSGKIIYSNDYKLLKNRKYLILSPISENENEVYFIEKNQLEVKIPINLSICQVSKISNTNQYTIFVDVEKLIFPLEIRKWNEGESFQPFGMNGKSKKVSKFFKDEKLSVIEKEKIWILLSDKKIVWIIGLREDHRFKIENNTQNILQITHNL